MTLGPRGTVTHPLTARTRTAHKKIFFLSFNMSSPSPHLPPCGAGAGVGVGTTFIQPFGHSLT